MDWNELKTFLAVTDSASFSRASEQLFISQPAVSKRIQTLESKLGHKLFDRVGKRVFLTRSGEILLPRARLLVAATEDTRTLMKNLGGDRAGTLTLATSHHIGLHRLAPVLQQFSRECPEVRLDIRFVDSEIAHELVRRAEAEIAVVTLDPTMVAAATPPEQQEKAAAGIASTSVKLEYQVIWRDPLVFVVADAHPLGRKATTLHPVKAAALLQYPAILPGLSTFTGQIVHRAFLSLGLELEPGMSTNYLETIAMLVSIGLGWSLLPRSMVPFPLETAPEEPTPVASAPVSRSDPGSVQHLVARGLAPVRTLDVAVPALERLLGCIVNPGRTRSNAAVAFAEVLGRYADSAPDGAASDPSAPAPASLLQ